MTGGKSLPSEVLQQIVRKTDGVPLFVEELTKMVLESELVRETEDHYELTGAAAAVSDSLHVTGFAHGPVGSFGHSQRGRAAGSDPGTRVSL